MTAFIVQLCITLLVMIGGDALCAPNTSASHGLLTMPQLCSIAAPRQPATPTVSSQRHRNRTLRQSEGWPGVVRRPPRMSEAPSRAQRAQCVGAEFRRRPKDDARHPSAVCNCARRCRPEALAALATLAAVHSAGVETLAHRGETRALRIARSPRRGGSRFRIHDAA